MKGFQSLRSGLARGPLLAALPISCVQAGEAGETGRTGASSMGGHPVHRRPPPSPWIPTALMDLPEDMILGPVTGVFVDSRDHVWVSHLPIS